MTALGARVEEPPPSAGAFARARETIHQALFDLEGLVARARSSGESASASVSALDSQLARVERASRAGSSPERGAAARTYREQLATGLREVRESIDHLVEGDTDGEDPTRKLAGLQKPVDELISALVGENDLVKKIADGDQDPVTFYYLTKAAERTKKVNEAVSHLNKVIVLALLFLINESGAECNGFHMLLCTGQVAPFCPPPDRPGPCRYVDARGEDWTPPTPQGPAGGPGRAGDEIASAPEVVFVPEEDPKDKAHAPEGARKNQAGPPGKGTEATRPPGAVAGAGASNRGGAVSKRGGTDSPGRSLVPEGNTAKPTGVGLARVAAWPEPPVSAVPASHRRAEPEGTRATPAGPLGPPALAPEGTRGAGTTSLGPPGSSSPRQAAAPADGGEQQGSPRTAVNRSRTMGEFVRGPAHWAPWEHAHVPRIPPPAGSNIPEVETPPAQPDADVVRKGEEQATRLVEMFKALGELRDLIDLLARDLDRIRSGEVSLLVRMSRVLSSTQGRALAGLLHTWVRSETEGSAADGLLHLYADGALETMRRAADPTLTVEDREPLLQEAARRLEISAGMTRYLAGLEFMFAQMLTGNVSGVTSVRASIKFDDYLDALHDGSITPIGELYPVDLVALNGKIRRLEADLESLETWSRVEGVVELVGTVFTIAVDWPNIVSLARRVGVLARSGFRGAGNILRTAGEGIVRAMEGGGPFAGGGYVISGGGVLTTTTTARSVIGAGGIVTTTGPDAWQVLRILASSSNAAMRAGGGERSPLSNRGTVRTGPGKGPRRQTGTPDGTERWSSKPGNETSAENARGHFEHHRSEFPELKTERQYVDTANDFVTDPPETAEIFVRESGEVMIYDPPTNTFAVRTPEGPPATYMRPDLGAEYWAKDLAKHGGARATK